MLTDERLDKLSDLIRDSFRVHPNRDPIYVDVSDHLRRVRAPQHQIIFGRRGSGKSSLLVHFHRTSKSADVSTVYCNADEVKRLGYPDVLIRLLIDIMSCLPQRRRIGRKSLAAQRLADLRKLLDEAEQMSTTRQVSDKSTSGTKAGARWHGVTVDLSDSQAYENSFTSIFAEEKLDNLERHLGDFKDALRQGLRRRSMKNHLAVIVDDFYAIPPRLQPDVLDFLHRLVRGTDSYLKVGTIRHRTALTRYEAGQTIGLEPSQDYESLDLDQTFENARETQRYLSKMLDSLGLKVGIESASQEFISAEGLLQLTLASGGVPRDYLNIFDAALVAARGATPIPERLTPKWIYKGAAREAYRTKLRNFREDAGGDVAKLERLLQDVILFTLIEKRKTAFLVSQREAQSDPEGHELIRQLMDFKLIHVVEPDTSAASGRTGRFEAYTLDFSTFMEPRRRKIEIVEFWKSDSSHRPRGIREAPVYPLSRARTVADQPQEADADAALDSVDAEFGFAQGDEEQ